MAYDDDFVFPVDLSAYKNISIDPWAEETLSAETKVALEANIQLCRDAIVFFTACGAASGYGGHTGGAFDTVPEVMMLDAMFRGCPDRFVPILFDEAGHRVATQYLMAVLRGELDAKRLRHYRKGHKGLPGHPELGLTPGVQFSSGRLGHMWAYINGVAMANPGKAVVCLGSDGSQMEGNDAEAARLAVAQNLNVKLVVDDNDVTITGHPSDYLGGFNTATTLAGHGLAVEECTAEDIDKLYLALRNTIVRNGPTACISRRPMCPGIDGVEGTSGGHDAVAVAKAIPYLEARGLTAAAEYLKSVKKTADPQSEYLGTGDKGSMRSTCGDSIVKAIAVIPEAERTSKVMVIDSDLGGSTAMTKVQKAFPEVYVQSGVMERGNFSAAAGFGMEKGKQGVFSTFAAFLEMCLSEITMARLNNSNVLCHFSHSGVDDMADNTCHFGLNNLMADNGLSDSYETKLYFPGDAAQVDAVVTRVFNDPGLRFVFTTRSKTPAILKPDGSAMYGEGYEFVPGKDDIVREGTAGFIVTFGDALYRCVDAAERLKAEGIDVGVINKTTLNVIDEEVMAKIGASGFVLVVEPLGRKTGLGSKFGSYLLERGLTPKFAYIGVDKEGSGGLWEHAYHQGYDSASVQAKVKSLV